MATEWTLAAKTVRPLPVEHKPLSDEARSRMRYVDLIVRPEARENVRVKAKVLQSLRATLDAQEYIEVETPVLQHTNGGAAARPFSTHVNAFDEGALLRIAIELHLKRALVGGVDRVYEIGKTFRNEGVDNTHNPEFMMLEVYEAYGSYDTMAELTRDLVVDAARAVGRTVVTARDGSEIDLEAPWRNATLHELVSEAVDQTIDLDTPVQDLGRDRGCPRRHAATGVGHRRHRPGAVREARRAHPHPADVRPRLPGVGAPSGQARTAPQPAWSRPGTSSSTASSSASPTPSSTTRSSSANAWRSRPASPPPAIPRPWASTRTSSAPWSSACLRPAAWASASTAS